MWAMSPKNAILLTSVACLAAASAEPILPGYDPIKASASFSGGMGVDGGGDLELWQFEARSIISPVLTPFDNFSIIPVLQYKATIMDFPNAEDQDLHSISLSSFFIYSEKSSPWIFGGWARAEMASNFDTGTNGDAMSYDVIAGAAYKISDTLTVGLGAAAINLNNDDEYYVGPAIDWKPNDCFHVGLLGPNAVASYTPGEDWEFSLRGDASGDEWDVDNGTTLDLDSYRIGLYVDRRLTGDLWLRIGGGITVSNSLELETTNGDRLFKEDLGEGWFGEIALRLAVW